MLELVQNRIAACLDALGDAQIADELKQVPQGKMLRSKLIFAITGEKEEAVNLAAIIEMVHMASLLHDDVIDESETRRGKQAVHMKVGTKNAIMLGDILYSKGFQELTQMDSRIAQSVSKAVTLLSIGEMLDVQLAQRFQSDSFLYLDMIYKKTASLIEASAFSAAIMAGKDAKKMGAYGKNLGLAFQVVDDILDVTQSDEVLGKPSMGDFAEGKTTLPYIYLNERMDNSGKSILASLHGKKPTPEEAQWLRDQLMESGAIDQSKEVARAYGEEAMKNIEEKNPKLQGMISKMIDRVF